MTKSELANLIPHKSMVWSNRDNVGYTFLGIAVDGLYYLCGMPYGYEDYLILNSFHIR